MYYIGPLVRKEKPMLMGAYGIGLGRLMASSVEMNHDESGIIWPVSIAPFDVHIVAVGEEESVKESAEKAYEILSKKYEVIYDDRDDVSAGVKFNDADLIGVPVRVVVSAKTQSSDSVEVKERAGGDPKMVALDEDDLLKAISGALGKE